MIVFVNCASNLLLVVNGYHDSGDTMHISWYLQEYTGREKQRCMVADQKENAQLAPFKFSNLRTGVHCNRQVSIHYLGHRYVCGGTAAAFIVARNALRISPVGNIP